MHPQHLLRLLLLMLETMLLAIESLTPFHRCRARGQKRIPDRVEIAVRIDADGGEEVTPHQHGVHGLVHQVDHLGAGEYRCILGSKLQPCT